MVILNKDFMTDIVRVNERYQYYFSKVELQSILVNYIDSNSNDSSSYEQQLLDVLIQRLLAPDGIIYFNSIININGIEQFYKIIELVGDKLDYSFYLRLLKTNPTYFNHLKGYIDSFKIDTIFNYKKIPLNLLKAYVTLHPQFKDQVIDLKKYIDYLATIPLLTDEEELSLLENGRNEISKYYLRLVLIIALRTSSSSKNIWDDIQNGYIGLISAINNYDINKNTLFSVYAYNPIIRSIMRVKSQTNDIISVPEYYYKDKYNVIREKKRYQTRFNKELSVERLANALGIQVERVIKILSSNICATNISDLSERERSYYYSIPDIECQMEIDLENKEMFKRFIELVSEICSPKEFDFLSLRFGFQGKEYSNSEIAQIYHVTRQYVGEVFQRAFIKIKNSSEIQRLICGSKNLFDEFEDKSVEYIKMLIEQLPEESKKFLKKKYGSNYGEVHYNLKLCDLIKVEEIIETINTAIEFLEGYVDSDKIDNVFDFMQTIYYSFPDYKIEEVNEAINSLSLENINLLNERFGFDYLHPHIKNNIKINDVVKEIKSVLKSVPKRVNISFFESFGTSYMDKTFIRVLKALTENEFDFLNMVYPSGLRNPLKENLTKKEKERLLLIKFKVRKRYYNALKSKADIQTLVPVDNVFRVNNFTFLNSEIFNSFISSFDDLDQSIIRMKFSLDKIYYTDQEISYTLNIDIEQIYLVCRRCLAAYRTYCLNNNIDVKSVDEILSKRLVLEY